ncbi:hypothetical protein ACQP25_17505 [Microtetraspora malaysiensis]|uniref:hypothetical protein n=1 Tax=Microtetraspora malaysiensis TaxID=161358 RepID=UPI003D8AE0EA
MAIVVAAAAGWTYAVASQSTETAAGAADVPKIDGVEVRYVPDGLGQPERLPAMGADQREGALRWQDSDGLQTVQVSVYRSPKISGAMDILALNVMRSPVVPRKDSDPVISEDGTDMMWLIDRGLLVRVTTSELAKDALEAIARGLHVAKAPA